MPAPTPPPIFFALSESRPLAAQVCVEAGLTLAALEERRFEGNEFKLRPLDSPRGHTAFILQSLAGSADASVAERLMRLLFLISGLRDSGAERIVALVPYLAFGRKDRRTQPRDPVTTRYIAELLEAAGASRVVSLDVHNAAAFDNAYRIPTDHLSALPLMADYFAKMHRGEQYAVASPDIGGIKRAQSFREQLQTRLGQSVELVFVEKRRTTAGGLSGGTMVGDVANRHVILIDDLSATGGTLIRAAEACKHAGALEVRAAVTHAPIAAGLRALVEAKALACVVITDSVGIGWYPHSLSESGKLVSLSIAPLFGQAVKRMVQGRPLAPLLSQWPVPQDA
jgi:ribose-phosphate pyrophosphokinase